jgi:hypothetical protein
MGSERVSTCIPSSLVPPFPLMILLLPFACTTIVLTCGTVVPRSPCPTATTGLQECTRVIDAGPPSAVHRPPLAILIICTIPGPMTGTMRVVRAGAGGTTATCSAYPRLHKNNKNYNYTIINMIPDSHR